MLTVACVYKQSAVYSNRNWVRKLYSMVECNLSQPFRFVCISTDLFNGQNPFHADYQHMVQSPPEVIPPDGWPAWWLKINLFGLKGDRILYLDLDTIVMDSLDDLVNYPSDFVMAPTSGVPTKGHDFNSSVMVWTPGSLQHQFIKSAMPPDWKRYAGDQQWLSSLKMQIDAFPYRWIHKYLPGKGPYLPPDGTRVALMIQGGKNLALLDSGHNWIAEYWR